MGAVSATELREHLEQRDVDLSAGDSTGYVDLFEGVSTENEACLCTLGLDPAAIGFGLGNVEYDPELSPGLVYYLDEYQTATIIFEEGIVATVDAPDPETAREAVLTTCKKLDDVNLLVEPVTADDITVAVDEIPLPEGISLGTNTDEARQDVYDPDGVATEQWDRAADTDVEETLIGALVDVATQYQEYYDISFVEAAFRTADEAIDWATVDRSHYLTVSHMSLFERADGYIEVVLPPRSINSVVKYVVDNWERCEDADDACRLFLEATIGVSILHATGSVDELDFETSIDDQTIPESRAGEDWNAVFDAQRGAFRMVALRDIAALWTEEFDETTTESLQNVARTYADAHNTHKAFKESRKMVYAPAGREDRPKELWRDDITGEEWISRLAADWYEQYLRNVCESVRPSMECD